MTSVNLLTTKPDQVTTPVGRIDFYALPIQKQDDFLCTPPGIISFDEAQTIAVELYQQVAQGRVGRYEWRRGRWWQSWLCGWLRRLRARLTARRRPR